MSQDGTDDTLGEGAQALLAEWEPIRVVHVSVQFPGEGVVEGLPAVPCPSSGKPPLGQCLVDLHGRIELDGNDPRGLDSSLQRRGDDPRPRREMGYGLGCLRSAAVGQRVAGQIGVDHPMRIQNLAVADEKRLGC